MKRFALALLLCYGFEATAAPNYHLVGWTNTFVPGGGALLLGNTDAAAIQSSVELLTFGTGFAISAKTPMTLDGVPEQIPTPDAVNIPSSTGIRLCLGRGTRLPCHPATTTPSETLLSAKPVDLSRALFADVLQEIGLKYHMVNVYQSYVQAAKDSHVENAELDFTPTRDLFYAPFDVDVISSAWVYVPIAISAAALVYSYSATQSSHDYGPTAKLNRSSKILYHVTYVGVYPVGSAVPEEMFYRGFLQNEMLSLFGSPYVSVLLSTALYSLSHSADEQEVAAVTGLYLGYLAHRNHGSLKQGIAFHFWTDVLTGFYTFAMLRLAQTYSPVQAGTGAIDRPVGMQFSFEF